MTPPDRRLPPSDQKHQLRAALRDRRRALGDAQRIPASERIAQHVLALAAWRDARTVMLYLAVPDEEPDTDALAAAVLAQGKRLVVPRLESVHAPMEAVRVTSLAGMAMAGLPLAIRQPLPGVGEPWDPAQIDLNLIPCVGVDIWGTRLGLGGGHYDRLLLQAKPDAVNLGLVFACQVVEQLPREPHDLRLSGFVSEEGVVWRK